MFLGLQLEWQSAAQDISSGEEIFLGIHIGYAVVFSVARVAVEQPFSAVLFFFKYIYIYIYIFRRVLTLSGSFFRVGFLWNQRDASPPPPAFCGAILFGDEAALGSLALACIELA